MKTLKKILSLVLIVAMLASMMIIGAAAAETTNYEEAVAVVTGVGIIEGDENGMNFTGNVTREQAAKIIAYLLLGKDTAESLKTGNAPFADVAANRWSAGYIAYLKGQGIISGVSDTEFDPTANVTGIAFAKMLLVAAGYGQNGEFEGNAWDINTITYANDNGVFAGSKAADLSKAATREEAMLYAFNVLTKVPVVKYNSTFESYYTGKSALDPVTGDVIATATGANDPYAYTLGWTKYNLKQTTTGTTDDFGRPAASWTASGAYVAAAIANVEPFAVLTGTVYSVNLYNTLGKNIVNNLNENKANVTVTIDGKLQAGTPIKTDIVAGEYTNSIGATGAVSELYLFQDTNTGDYYLDIVVWYEHLAKVNRVATAGGVTTLHLDDIAGGNTTVTSEQLDVAGIAKGDYVVYTKGETEVASIAVATPVVGVYSNYNNTMMQYTIDGAFVSASNVGDASALDTFGGSYEIYYNGMGQILYAAEYDVAGASGAYEYIYVQGSQVQKKGNDLINNVDTKVAFDVVYPDGGQAVVYGAVKADATGEYFLFGRDKIYITEAKANVIPDGWYSYTTNDAGQITLKPLNTTYADVADAITTTTSRATISGIAGYTANSATILNVVNEDGVVVTYNGIANFPANTFGAADAVLYTYAKNSKALKTVTAYIGAADVTSSLNLAYCAGDWQSDENGTTYMFYVDGVMQFITLDVDTYKDAYNKIDFTNPEWYLDADAYTAWLTYDAYVPQTGCIYDLDVTDGEYLATKVGAYADTAAANDAGTVNAGYAMDFAGTGVKGTNQVNYASFSFITFAYSYYEWATIDTIDDNYFSTVAVAADDVIDSVGGIAVGANTYYFDDNTLVYDTTGAGATELNEGDVFVAYIDEAASVTFGGVPYAAIIWIVG